MVGKQSGREIRPFETETGEELLFLYPGMRKQDEVFDYEHAQNRLQTWIYRLLGWLAMFLGYNCVSNLLDIIGMYLLRLPHMNIFRKVKLLSKNSILTKPQYFHEFFTQLFFDNFSREIKVVNS